MGTGIVATRTRRGIDSIPVALLVVATTFFVDARTAPAQLAVDELELRLPLRRGAEPPSGAFHAANASAQPTQVTISIQDWDRSETGENRYYPLGTLPTSCASHIKVFPSVLELGARTTQTIRVALDSGWALPRGCYAILFVETPPPPKGTHTSGMTYSLRYGVKVYVEPEAAPTAELDDVFLERQATDSVRRMVIAYRNTGARQTMARGTVEIRRTDNTLVSTLDIPEFPTLPGATRRLGVPLPRLPRGKYVLLALLDYEGSEIAAGQVDLEIP